MAPHVGEQFLHDFGAQLGLFGAVDHVVHAAERAIVVAKADGRDLDVNGEDVLGLVPVVLGLEPPGGARGVEGGAR
jgi:hypothetical protein